MILQQIEAALRRHSMTATAFSRDACNDPRLVSDMRNGGRGLSLRMEAKVLAYIDALDSGEVVPPKRQVYLERLPKPPKVMDISHLPALNDGYEGRARRNADAANAAFLKALAKVSPVGDVAVAPEPRFARLPPPALNCGANS